MGPDGRQPGKGWRALRAPASRLVAAVGSAAVLSFAILASYFPKHLAGRANGALNLFYIAAAFVVQYATGVVLQHWPPEAGRHPEIAYQIAFALNLAIQAAAWICETEWIR
jgi:MFS family permease